MSTDIYSIYLVTNLLEPTKHYVGYTKNTKKRFQSHKTSKRNTPFHNALRKYGSNNFEWEIIYQSLDGKYCLEIMEPYFIKEYDSFYNGYNLTKGGEGGDTSKSENYINSMKQRNNKGMGFNFKRKGIIETIETRGKKSESHAFIWLLTDPKGFSFEVKNLTKFCKNSEDVYGYKLYDSCMVYVSQGKYTNHKGWLCSKANHSILS